MSKIEQLQPPEFPIAAKDLAKCLIMLRQLRTYSFHRAQWEQQQDTTVENFSNCFLAMEDYEHFESAIMSVTRNKPTGKKQTAEFEKALSNIE